mgnify:FL=1
MIYKTNQEMSFVFNPIDFTKMIQTPIPMTGLVTQLWKGIKNFLDETRDVVVGEDDILSTGKTKDDPTGRGYYLTSFIPGGNILRII